MYLSTHYYVLALGPDSAELYEAFRDSLIGVEDEGFPVVGATDDANGRSLMQSIDAKLDACQDGGPLGLVVVGDREQQSLFDSVTSHSGEIVVRLVGDRSEVRPDELGQIVWPMVKEEISGALEQAMFDLEDSVRRGATVSGLQAVVATLGDGRSGDLLVEEDYRFRGSVLMEPGPARVFPEADIRDVFDDVVDAVIEQVLVRGGRVTFTRAGTLDDHEHIVLMLREDIRP